MATPDSEQPPTGVWVHPSGTRVEVAQEGDGWRTSIYMTRSGGTPGAVHDFDRPEQVQDAIAGFETKGYVRQRDREPDGPRRVGGQVGPQRQPPGQWIAVLIVVAIALVLVVVLSSVG